MSSSLSSYLVPILNSASLFGRILPGYVGDKVGRFNTIIVMSFFTAVVCLALWIPASSNAATIVFAALYGFGSGTFVSMAPALVAQITPDLSKIGVRTGTVFIFISFAALVSNPIGGALVEARGGGFLGLQIFGGVVQCAAGVVLVGARVSSGGWSLKAKV